jgi:hypothetical protein
MKIPGSWPDSEHSSLPTEDSFTQHMGPANTESARFEGHQDNHPSESGSISDVHNVVLFEPNTTGEPSANNIDELGPVSQSDGTSFPPNDTSVAATAEDQSQPHPHEIEKAMTRLQVGEDPRTTADADFNTAIEGSVAPFLASHPLIARLQQHQTTSSTVNATAMEALEALHRREITWLNEQHEEATARMSDEIRDLRVENHELEIDLRRHERTIADKDQQIYHLTSSGQPHPTEACALCGRVGDRYAEDPQPPTVEQASGSNRKAKKTPANGKAWKDDPTTYTLPTRRAPDHHHNKAARIEAMIRRRDGRPKPGDKELIEWECSSDDEEVQAGKNNRKEDSDDDADVDGAGWAAAGANPTIESTQSTGGW